MIKLGPPKRVVLLTPSTSSTPDFVEEVLAAKPAPFHWLGPVGSFRARSRYWFIKQLKCEACFGDGYNMDLDGPKPCGACNATGNKDGKYGILV